MRCPCKFDGVKTYKPLIFGRGTSLPQEMEQRGTASEHLRMAVAVGHIGIWELDTVTGEAWRNAQHDALFGYEELRDSWTYDDFLNHVVEEDREDVDTAHRAALKSKSEWSFECRIRRTDGMIRWISAHGRPLPGEDGRNERMIGHVIDISETKRSEEHLRLVTAELNHRLQNIIGTISGLIGLSAREAGDPSEIAKVLQGRLAALGRSHNLTFRDRSESVAIVEALETERGALPGLADQVVIDVDPKLHIAAPLAERVLLVIHELATNAIKYGALSMPGGKVCIDSHLAKSGELEIDWREIDGPPVAAPTRKGFGTRLIDTALRGDGKVEQVFGEDGVTCRITLPAIAVKVKP